MTRLRIRSPPTGTYPEDGTKSEDAVDFEGLRAVVVVAAQAIAQYHTEVLLSTMGNGHRFVIHVSKHLGVSHTVGGTVGGAAGGAVRGEVINVVGGAVSGGVGSLLTYVLTRR